MIETALIILAFVAATPIIVGFCGVVCMVAFFIWTSVDARRRGRA